MLVVFRPMFFCGEYLFLRDVCGGVVFLPEVLWDLKARLVIISVWARLFVVLSVGSIPFRFSIVMLIGFCVYIEDV